MSRSEIVTVFIFALISIAIGYVLFRKLVDPSTLKLKPHVLGMLERFRAWLRAKIKKIILAVSLAAAAVVLLFLAFRFTGRLIDAVKALVSRPPVAELAAEAEVPTESTTVAEGGYIEDTAIVADHSVVTEVRLDRLPAAAIEEAKARLHIFYVYGTHGSQLVYGMKGLEKYKGPLYAGLDVDAVELSDSKEPDLEDWAERVRTHLTDPDNRDTNVVIWAWSDELSSAGEQAVMDYLRLTSDLEKEFSPVKFVYMTGHLDGTGLDGNLHLRNNQIRDYCREHSKILYDFADIESYDPDGKYYADKSANDGCWYDSDGNGSLDRNWAKEWSEANPGLWYDCYAAHTYPLNANLKAYAAWWLWVKLAEDESKGESQ